LTQGTGNGEYKIKTAKISEDENSQEATESVAEISGTAVTGQQEEKTVTVENNQVTTEKKDTTPLSLPAMRQQSRTPMVGITKM